MIVRLLLRWGGGVDFRGACRCYIFQGQCVCTLSHLLFVALDVLCRHLVVVDTRKLSGCAAVLSFRGSRGYIHIVRFHVCAMVRFLLGVLSTYAMFCSGTRKICCWWRFQGKNSIHRMWGEGGVACGLLCWLQWPLLPLARRRSSKANASTSVSLSIVSDRQKLVHGGKERVLPYMVLLSCALRVCVALSVLVCACLGSDGPR